jgi:hypothetical protein
MTLWIVVAEFSDWRGWEALVAIGTLFLAGATFRLARATRDLARETAEEVQHSKRQVDAALEQVRVAQEQAATAAAALESARKQTEIAQLTLDAQIKPVLVDVQPNLTIPDQVGFPGKSPVQRSQGAVVVKTSNHEVLISVPFRNAGVGLAIVRAVGIRSRTEIGTPGHLIRPTNVAPGEHGRVGFRAQDGSAAFRPLLDVIDDQQDFSVEIGYTDLAGQQYERSILDLYYVDGQGYGIRQVHHQKPGADEPFAASAPAE